MVAQEEDGYFIISAVLGYRVFRVGCAINEPTNHSFIVGTKYI